MTYTVVATERAARDIEDATEWWAQHHSVEQAERWYSGIRQAIAELCTEAERCAIAAEQKRFSYPIRELHYGAGSKAHPTHRAIFTIVGQTVLVLTVRHAGRALLRPRDLD